MRRSMDSMAISPVLHFFFCWVRFWSGAKCGTLWPCWRHPINSYMVVLASFEIRLNACDSNDVSDTPPAAPTHPELSAISKVSVAVGKLRNDSPSKKESCWAQSQPSFISLPWALWVQMGVQVLTVNSDRTFRFISYWELLLEYSHRIDSRPINVRLPCYHASPPICLFLCARPSASAPELS